MNTQPKLTEKEKLRITGFELAKYYNSNKLERKMEIEIELRDIGMWPPVRHINKNPGSQTFSVHNHV